MTRTQTVLITAIAMLASGPAVDAQQRPLSSDPDEFVLGNVQFMLLHELAHLVIGEKRIPILGSEEYAADYIAAMLLIQPREDATLDHEMLLRFAIDTADGFVVAWQRSAEYATPMPYWGTHALQVQRFSTVACLLYGSDPQRFAALPQVVEMPLARANSCPAEFKKAAFAVDWLFETYARKPDDPPGAAVEIRFEPPPSRTSARLLQAIQARGLVENTFARLGDYFSLDEPAKFIMRACGQPQAAWIAETRELVFCYELLDTYSLMSQSAKPRAAIAELLKDAGN